MHHLPVKTIYMSKDVEIPDDFLKSEPHDAKPITFQQINFEDTVLNDYKGLYAVVLDHVLSPSECAQLIELAEASVINEIRNRENGSAWAPALVNVGGGYEMQQPEYRNSDRIIWDQQEIVDRLWARLEQVPQIKDALLSFSQERRRIAPHLPGQPPQYTIKKTWWNFHSINKRMRFLKYGEGQFFRPHCDSPYTGIADDGHAVTTFYTLHLYLNDSKEEAGEQADLVGGATSFHSVDMSRKLDVNCKAGRVLIFQHRRLYHSGDNVKEGTKFSMRSDIMYRVGHDPSDLD